MNIKERLYQYYLLTRLHKPIGILNVAGFYDGLLAFLDELVEQDFVGPRHRSLLRCADNVPDLVDQLASAAMPAAT